MIKRQICAHRDDESMQHYDLIDDNSCISITNSDTSSYEIISESYSKTFQRLYTAVSAKFAIQFPHIIIYQILAKVVIDMPTPSQSAIFKRMLRWPVVRKFESNKKF